MPHSVLNLSRMIHWRDGTMNTDKQKHLFWNAVEHISWQRLEAMRKQRIKAEYVVEEWARHGLSHAELPTLASDSFMLTPPGGAWYYTYLASMSSSAEDGQIFQPKDFEVPTLAYHSCSVDTGAEVIKSGGLKVGVAASDGVEGVYCEGDKRKDCLLNYGTHTIHRDHPTIATCAILELCVDRGHAGYGIRQTVQKQWVQQEDRIFIVGVYTHLFPIAQLYAKGFIGWYRIHNTVFTALHILQVDDNGNPLDSENAMDQLVETMAADI